MTMTNLNRKTVTLGNDVTQGFPMSAPFFASGLTPEVYPELEVTLRVTSTGVETVQAFTTDYTVSLFTGAADGSTSGTCQVDMVVAPAIGYEVHCRRVTALTQLLAFVQGGPFPHARHEHALDRASMRAIDVADEVSRALKFPRTDSSPTELPNSVARASGILGFDIDGDMVPVVSLTPDNPVSAFMAPVLTAADLAKSKTLLEIRDANALYNNCGYFQRRGLLGAVGDDTYLLDGWKLLNESGTSLPAQDYSFHPPLCASSVRLETTTLQKQCLVQVVSTAETIRIRKSGGFEASMWFHRDELLGDYHLYVLGFTGLDDNPLSDPVLTWNGDATVPTWDGAWETLGSVSLSTVLSGTWEYFSLAVTGGLVGLTQLAFVFGAIETETAGSRIIRGSRCFIGEKGASSFAVQEDLAEEERRCASTYWTTFPPIARGTGSIPALGAGGTGCISTMGATGLGAKDNFAMDVRFPTPMLAVPDVTLWNPTPGAPIAGMLWNASDGSQNTIPLVSNKGRLSFRIGPTTSITGDDDDEMVVHAEAKVEL